MIWRIALSNPSTISVFADKAALQRKCSCSQSFFLVMDQGEQNASFLVAANLYKKVLDEADERGLDLNKLNVLEIYPKNDSVVVQLEILP